MDARQQGTRSRSGCWTCRSRKKKCDGENFPCMNCVRLNLVCDRGTKLVWEDDARRKGMQRRGPRKRTPAATPESRSESRSRCIVSTKRSKSFDSFPDLGQNTSKLSPIYAPPGTTCMSLSMQLQLPIVQGLTTDEYVLLDRYIQRFSRIYPTFSDPNNPFLSILLPLATQHHAVMSAVLALSGAQFEIQPGSNIAKATLRARHHALEGCRALLASSGSLMSPHNSNPGESSANDSNTGSNNILFILASCICLLLYEKLVGDGKANWMPHLAFLAGLFERLENPRNDKLLQSIRSGHQERQAFDFIHHLFLYNDLLHSTAQRKSTLSNFYLQPLMRSTASSKSMLQAKPSQWDNSIKHSRFYYPYLVAQMSAGEQSISDACIDAWDGRLDWLPSFSLLGVRLSSNPISPVQDNPEAHEIDLDHNSLMVSIYRDTAKVYLRQCLRRRQGYEILSQCGLETVDLACHATFLISQLPDGSSFENALLWPIGIIGPELRATNISQRQYLFERLRALEQRFQMKHFERVREVLSKGWDRAARLGSMQRNWVEDNDYGDDVFLFG